jgi:inhibitor of KinA sporulation pathway (predicted exonuclease)
MHLDGVAREVKYGVETALLPDLGPVIAEARSGNAVARGPYAGGVDFSGRLLNVIDVEATCWEGDAPAGQVSEIIEVGLCVVDLTARRRLERHAILVAPQYSVVSEFCTRLTGLTSADLEGAVSFAEACGRLVAEHDAADRTWASWGDYDRKQFASQCAATGVSYPFGPSHVNAKAVFATAHGLRRRPGMAQALDLVALPLEGRHHRGVDDAWNIAALILHLAERDEWRSVATS